MDGGQTAILDTSVLLNFIVIDRLDLLGAHPTYRFVVTEHVRAEITDHYPDQQTILEEGLRSAVLEEIRVDGEEELKLFAKLIGDGRLGAGESSAIAAACVRGVPVAVDDGRARRRAKSHWPGIVLLGTQSLMVDLVRAGEIDVAAADVIKELWQNEHRFRLPFESFADVI